MKPKSPLRAFLLAVGSSLLAISSAHAAIRTWGGGNLDWTNTTLSGWNAAVPVAADTATINSGTVTVTTSIAVGNTPGTINVNGGMLVISTGKLVGGTYTAAKTFTIGSGATLRLNSWGYDVAGSLGALDYGRDRLVVNGGIIEVTGNSSESGRIFTVGSGGATLRSSVNSGQTWTLFRDGNVLYHDIRVNDGRTLTLDGTGNGAIGNHIVNTSGSGNITKAGAGTWTLTGANTYTGTTSISAGTLSAGDIVVTGGNSHLGNATSAVTLGSAGAQGTLSYTGISDSYTRGFTIGGAGGGRLDVTTSGQTLTVGTGAVTGSGLFTVGGAGNTTISANLTHTGGLTKTGAGTLTISAGTHTFNGVTAVNQGTLIVNGNISTSSSVTVASGATLTGSGTVGATTITGTHSPGNSPGLSSHTSLTYEAGSNVIWELVANSTGGRTTSYDGINLTTGLAFNGATTLDLVFNFGASAVEWNDTFWASDYTGTSGWLIYSGATSLTGFDNLDLNLPTAWTDENGDTLASARSGASFSLFQDSNNIYLNYTAIPEPGAALLGSLGLLALLRRRRS